MEYDNLDIWVDADGDSGDHYRVWATGIGGETPRISTRIALSEHALRVSLERLEQRDTDEEFLADLGGWLYQQLVQGHVETVVRDSLSASRAEPERGARLRLRLAPPEVSALPWELLYSQAAGGFLATRRDCPLVRYVEQLRRVPRLEAPLPLGVLVAIPANHSPYPALDAAEERRAIEKALSDLGDRIRARYLDGDVSLARLRDVLEQDVYHCLHFIGHGNFEHGRGSLVLNAADGGNEEVDAERFASLFREHPDLKLVVLNACKGAAASTTKPLVSTASQLVHQGLPAVVAMRFSVYDDAAVSFARTFYDCLFGGPHRGRVDVAVSAARSALAKEMPDDRELGAPVLFMRARDGLLFDPVSVNPLENLALSREAMHTEKLVEAAHEHNLELLDTERESATDDRDVRAELARERAELQRFKQRIRLRNALVVTATAAVALAFALSFVRLFDVLGLDTKVETWTMTLGGVFAEPRFSDEIALVVIGEEETNRVGKTFAQAPKSWRREHAAVVDRLHQAGARVIALGIFFEELDSRTLADRELLRAISATTGSATRVIVGTTKRAGGRLHVPDALRRASSGHGTACIGRKLGVALSDPLLMTDRGGSFPSLVLATHVAVHGVSGGPGAPVRFELDPDAGLIRGYGARGRPVEVGFSTLTTRRGGNWLMKRLTRFWPDTRGPRCEALDSSERLAHLLVLSSSLEELRHPSRYHSYGAVLAASRDALRRQFAGKIVFVGADDGQRYRTSVLGGPGRLGIELLADALNTSLRGVRIHPLAETQQLLVMIALGLIGALVRYWVPKSSWRLRRTSMALVTVFYLAVTVYTFAQYFVLLNTLYHIGALWLSYWLSGKVERRWFP